MPGEPQLIREFSVHTCTDTIRLSQQMNSASRQGWEVFQVVPTGRLYLLICFRLIPKPAVRRMP